MGRVQRPWLWFQYPFDILLLVLVNVEWPIPLVVKFFSSGLLVLDLIIIAANLFAMQRRDYGHASQSSTVSMDMEAGYQPPENVPKKSPAKIGSDGEVQDRLPDKLASDEQPLGVPEGEKSKSITPLH